jgi:hypothetical protein
MGPLPLLQYRIKMNDDPHTKSNQHYSSAKPLRRPFTKDSVVFLRSRVSAFSLSVRPCAFVASRARDDILFERLLLSPARVESELPRELSGLTGNAPSDIGRITGMLAFFQPISTNQAVA